MAGTLESLTAQPYHAAPPATPGTGLSTLTSKPYSPPTASLYDQVKPPGEAPEAPKPATSRLSSLTSKPYSAHPEAKPEEKPVTSTIPAKLGGGSYNRVPGNDNKVVNTGHTSYAGMPTKEGYQRNDIVPVSLGGQNSNEKNMEYEPQSEADYRDNIEKYYAGQVKSGKMPLNAARVKVLDWKNTDIPGQDAYSKKLGGDQNLLTNFVKSIPEGVKSVARGVNTVGNEIIEGAKEGWQQAEANTQEKKWSNLGEPALDSGVKSFSDTLQDTWQRIQHMTDTAMDEHATKLEMGASEEEAAMGALNVLFTPVTTSLATVSGIPGVGQLADKVSELFGAISGGAIKVASGALDDMPISDETRETLRQPVEEVSALVAQLVAGKVGDEVIPRIAEKTKTIVSAIKDHVDSIPNKQGGFIKNPAFSGDTHADAHTLTSAAEKHADAFQTKIDTVAQGLGHEVEHGPVKTAERIEEKAHTDYGGDVSQVKDANRSTILVKNPSDIAKIGDRLHEEFGEVTRVKPPSESSGEFKKVIYNVRTEGGHEGEIQVTTKDMYDAKKAGGHEWYSHTRVSRGDFESQIEKHMQALYQAAEESPRSRTSDGESLWPSATHLKGEYGLPVETTIPNTSSVDGSKSTLTTTSPTSKNSGYFEDIQHSVADSGENVNGENADPHESEIGSQTQAPDKQTIKWTIPMPRARTRNEVFEPHEEYDPEITERNGNVLPPINKGGLQAPEIDWTKAKDIAALRLSTDTMERNVEKIFGPEAKKINDFLVEPTRANETARAKFVSKLREEIKAKVVDELGIRARSKDSALVQQFGEGIKTMKDVEAEVGEERAQKIADAAKYFRETYDKLWNMWDQERAAHGMKSIGKIDNYFRHFNDIESVMENFIPTMATGQIPTAISGITDYFKSRTPWSSAAMRRVGHETTIDAVSGLDNYLDVATRSIFHTDSVQRGRLLEKYLRQVAQAKPEALGKGVGLSLPNFASNLNDWTNLVSGKQARLDRAIESVVGRPALAFMRAMIRRFGANVIGGNISAATTHSIPLVYTLATTDTAAAFRGLMTTLSKPFMADFNRIGGQESAFLTRRYVNDVIDPTRGERIAKVISKPFQWVDEFISHFAVAGKFEEGRAKGLSARDAMAAADNYAARVIGDRSVGNLPNLMNTKTLGMITQFQIEVNDNLRVLLHDVPKWAGGNPGKVALTFAKFAVYSYLFNQVLQMIKGSGKGLDPINMGMTLAGLNDEGAGLGTVDRLKAFGTELAGELPFTSIVTQGQYPVLQGVPIADAMKGDWGTALQKVASSFASPIGGGVQALKTYKGIQAWKAGVVLDKSGKTITPIPQTLPTLLQGTAFGPSAFSDVKKTRAELSKLSGVLKLQQATSKAKNEQAASMASDLTKMAQTEGSAAAEQELTGIANTDPDMAQRVLTALKNQQMGITKSDTMLRTLGIKNGARAAYIKQKLEELKSPEEKQQYLIDLAGKKILTDDVLKQVLAQ